jgi:hypothetical protein
LAARALLTEAEFCSAGPASRIEPVYDPKTGVLQLLKYDTDGDGRIDTWHYMNGARVIRIEIDRDAEGLGDRVGGDVVMRRADAAGGEDIVELLPHLVDGGHDRGLDVGDDAAFPDLHAQYAEFGGEILDVGIARAAAQDLVADDDDTGGHDFCRL